MKETDEYIISKTPAVYINHVDYDNKVIILNDKNTTGYLWDTKVKYWMFNLEKRGYELKYG